MSGHPRGKVQTQKLTFLRSQAELSRTPTFCHLTTPSEYHNHRSGGGKLFASETLKGLLKALPSQYRRWRSAWSTVETQKPVS